MAEPILTPDQVARADEAARQIAPGSSRFNSSEGRELVRIGDLLDCIRMELVALRDAISGS